MTPAARRTVFQSLFSWMLLSGRAASVMIDSSWSGFNPCSRGCCSVASAVDPGRSGPAECFNPCSRGCCSVAPARSPSIAVDQGVSILVLVDVAQWRRSGVYQWTRSDRVSILVLVDVAQWRDRAAIGTCSATCFNPCSRGCCSVAPRMCSAAVCRTTFQSLFSWMLLSGVGGGQRCDRVDGVSILVLVDVAQWPRQRDQADRGSSRFQSLFSWMLLSGTAGALTETGDARVSILVLVDVAQWHELDPLPAMSRSGFNPCSRGCCSVACGSVRRRTPASMTGFNPCSRGCCSVARSRTHRCAGDVRGFNPCSRGCCSVAAESRATPYARPGFQSLFSWMLLSGPCP